MCVGSRGSLRSLRLERRKEQREEGDSKKVEVREGGECVRSRGSLRSGSTGLRVFCGARVFFNCVH